MKDAHKSLNLTDTNFNIIVEILINVLKDLEID